MSNGEENQLSNEQDSSEADDVNIFEKLKGGGKDQYQLHEYFRADVDQIIDYLQILKSVTEAFQSMCLSGKSYHLDSKSEVQNSGWRYMPNYLKKVEFVKSNQSEAESLFRLCDKLGQVEEYHFYDIIHVDHDSNIYYTATKQRVEVERLYVSVEKLVKTCNRRRNKVANAALLKDLIAQGPKYQKAVMKLDQDARTLSNNQKYIKANRSFHRLHCSQGLSVILKVTKARNDLMIEDEKKRQREKAKSRKSRKSANRRDRTLKK